MMTNKVWVFIDQYKGEALQASWEALGAARPVAEALGSGVTAVVFGQNVAAVAEAAGQFGADAVLLADDATLADFRLDPYASLFTALVKEHAPAVVLGTATTRGRDLFAAAAVDLGVCSIADATALDMDGETVRATHPVYAGKLLATFTVQPGQLQLITLRSRAFPKPDADPSRTAEVTSVAPVKAEDEIAVKVTGAEQAEGTVSLTDAGVIVAGGRGVGGPEGFEPVADLARALGGAMGASRAAVDAGWIPYAHQVGQTGKTVSPDLYIAAGISGAIQHLAGMRTAKVIVAINKDPDAPIFKLARFGVVGDLFDILPALTAEAKARLG